jgi:predicted SAM-dependent methyltransferase
MMLDFSHTVIGFDRPIASYHKVKLFVGALIRNRSAFLRIKPKGCLLDLGCGPNIDKQFCSLDFYWRPGVDICWDVTRGLPFPTEYVGGIFSEHMLEHIDFHAALTLLKECRRILMKGSILRLIIPDGELYLREYGQRLTGAGCSMPYQEDDSASFPFVTPMISVNRIFRFHGHKFIWDYETLRIALLRAEFSKVEKREFGEGSDMRLLRDTPSRRVESLYVEATR